MHNVSYWNASYISSGTTLGCEECFSKYQPKEMNGVDKKPFHSTSTGRCSQVLHATLLDAPNLVYIATKGRS